MSEIKALYNLHKLASDFRSDVYKRDEADYLLEIADGIQAEVDSLFMALPLDAKGVPIRVGDTVAEKPFRPKAGEKPAEVVCMLLNSDGWAVGDCDPRGHWYNSLQLEHVKPRTLEDVLADVVTLCANTWKDDESPFAFYGVSDVMESGNIKEYADEIRELMKEGGE